MNDWLDWRPPRGGIAFLAGCFVFASIVFILVDGGTPYTRLAGPIFLPIGIGLWLKHSWARWTTFGFFVVVALALLTVLVQQGITGRRVIQGLVITGSLISLWEWKVYSEDHVD